MRRRPGSRGHSQRVGSKEVEAAVAHVRWHRHRVEDALHGGTNPFLGGLPACGAGSVGSPDQIEQVRSFGLVELQSASDAFQHVVGDSDDAPALETGVVLDTDPGQHGRLFPSKPRDTAPAPEGGEPCLLRRDLRPARDEELTDVASRVHLLNATALAQR